MRTRVLRSTLPPTLLLVALGLTGCGGEDASERADEPRTAEPSEPTQTPTPSEIESPTESHTESSTPTPTPTEPEDAYADYRDDDGFVTADDYGKDWPLKVDAGFLECVESFGDRNGAVIFRTLDDVEYALNGQAAHDYPQIRPIWADDTTYGKNSGVKMSTMILLIDDALDLC